MSRTRSFKRRITVRIMGGSSGAVHTPHGSRSPVPPVSWDCGDEAQVHILIPMAPVVPVGTIAPRDTGVPFPQSRGILGMKPSSTLAASRSRPSWKLRNHARFALTRSPETDKLRPFEEEGEKAESGSRRQRRASGATWGNDKPASLRAQGKTGGGGGIRT